MWSYARLLSLALIPVTVVALFFVLPVTGMVSRGFADGAGGVWEVLGRPRVHRVLWFTLWSSAAGTAISLLVGVPSAYTLYRLRWPGVGLVRGVLLVPFVLPTVVVGVSFRELLGEAGPLAGLGLDGTAWAILAGLVFFNASVVIRTVGLAWQSLDTRPAEAAAALGASPLRVLRTVTLPSLRPAIVGAASVVFLFCATAFGVVLALGGLRYSSVETEIYLLTTNLLDLQGAAALSILQLVVVVILLLIASRATTAAAVRRVVARPRTPRWADAASLAVTGVLLLFVVGPLLALVVGSLRVRGRWTLANYRALGTPVDDTRVVAAIGTSLETAAVAAAMAVVLGALTAMVVTRRSVTPTERRLRSALDGLVMLPLGVSAVTLGFGFLITLGRFRDSPMLVPIAQALVALPLVVRILVPALAGIDDRLRQAASSLGAPPWRVLVTVDLPVLWRPLLGATGLAAAVSLGEFGATSFLARDSSPTLPVLIYRLISHPGTLNYGTALAASVALAALTAVVMLGVERLRLAGIGAF